MALARVVEFEGVSSERMKGVLGRIEGGPPADLPVKEIVVLHDDDSERALVVFFFDSDGDYEQGDATLNAMSNDETLGRRVSVRKYGVAHRQSV